MLEHVSSVTSVDASTLPLAADGPIIAPALSLRQRLTFFLSLWAMKMLVKIGLPIARLFSPPPASSRPTLVKAFPSRPLLRCRIFYPPSYSASSRPLPLYIDIHGGGFALCTPTDDDPFCSSWARRTNSLVVSINYRKAPRHPFPVPVDDCIAIVQDVLADASLPFDRSRVSAGGFSAGANLALAVVQAPSLKGKIQAVVAFYPVLDWTAAKKEPMSIAKEGEKRKPDVLAKTGAWFDWAYISAGVDRKDPRLSPTFAPRDSLPQHLYFVGAEHDMLCREAMVMAEKAVAVGVQREPEGAGWKAGSVSWDLVEGQLHGFTHVKLKDKDEERQRLALVEEVYARIARWLMQESLV